MERQILAWGGYDATTTRARSGTGTPDSFHIRGDDPAGAITTPNKLVIVFMENHGLAGITNPTGITAMPYLNTLWNGFTAGQFSYPTLWDQLSAAGDSWGVYLGSAPRTCYPGLYYNDITDTDTGPCKIGHNPAVPFAGVYGNSSECQNIQPLQAMNAASLPDVSFVAPNLCDDMHGVTSSQAAANGYINCVTGTTAIETRGDNWLAANVPAWASAGADVLITFDEGTGTSNQVYSVLTGPGVTGGNNATLYNHYSVLAGLEDSYGLPRLGNAATAAPIAFPGGTSAPPPPASCPAALRPGTTGAAGLSNAKPIWVMSATAGQTYSGSVFVQGSVTGEEATLLLRQTTPAGTVVGTGKTTVTRVSHVWRQIIATYAARSSGDLLHYLVYTSNFASSARNFLADCLSLWTPSPGG